MRHNGKGIPINCQRWISNLWKHGIQMKHQRYPLKRTRHGQFISVYIMSHVKRVILYDFLKIHHFLSKKWKVMTSLKPSYLRKLINVFFLNFASINYDMFVIGAKNVVPLRAPFRGYGAAKKLEAFNAPPPAPQQVAG